MSTREHCINILTICKYTSVSIPIGPFKKYLESRPISSILKERVWMRLEILIGANDYNQLFADFSHHINPHNNICSICLESLNGKYITCQNAHGIHKNCYIQLINKKCPMCSEVF
jgi:hypothetical protein